MGRDADAVLGGWYMIIAVDKATDKPVICAVCRDTGVIVRLPDGNHLTCALMDGRPIWGSKPKWCPKEKHT